MADEFMKAALYWIKTFNKKAKEKIWMMKLIALLNEYDNWWDYDDYYWPYQYWQDRDAYHLCKYQLVSKEYWFIKWLVENDKINLEEVEKINQTWNVYIRFWWDYEKVLMLLSISDTPIDDLISYLK